MQVELSTTALATVMKRISKGLVNNNFLDYTNYVMLTFSEDFIRFAVNDGSNVYTHYLNVGTDVDADTHVSINGEKFLQLVNKITSNKTKIKVDETGKKIVTVIANGSYTFEIEDVLVPVVEQDELLDGKENWCVLPPLDSFNKAEGGLSKLVVNPTLMGYYLKGKHIYTTNGVKLSDLTTEVELSETFYLTTRMVALIKTLDTEEEILISKKDGVNIIKTPTKIIYGPEQPGIDTFPNIPTIIDMELDYNFTADAHKLLESLDRLYVFNPNITLLEAKNGNVHFGLDDKKNTKEKVFDELDESIDTSVLLNIAELRDLLSRQDGVVTISFAGERRPIKISSKGLVQILAPVTVEGA